LPVTTAAFTRLARRVVRPAVYGWVTQFKKKLSPLRRAFGSEPVGRSTLKRALSISGHVLTSARAKIHECIATLMKTGRYRNLEGHNEIERANVARTIRDTLTKLNLDAHHGVILEKLFFDSNVSTIKDSDFCNPPVRGQQTKPDSIRVRESYCQRPPSRSRYCPARWPSISCR